MKWNPAASSVQELAKKLAIMFHKGIGPDNLSEDYAVKATTLAGYGITDAYTKIESDDLFAPKAGDSEQQFSIAAATMLAHALNLGQFTGSIQTNGFITIPIWDTITGNKIDFLIQWGTANWQGLTPIEFPTAFQSVVFGVFLTQKNGAAVTQSQAKNITLNNFVLDSDNEATIVSFLAIGV